MKPRPRFFLIFLSLGPIFCMNQIEAIVGKSVFDVKSIENRNAIYARLFAARICAA